MRFSTHEDFVKRHLRWMFCLQMVPRPVNFQLWGCEMQMLVPAFVCTAELVTARKCLCVIADDPAEAWLMLMDQVEAAERDGA